MGTQFDDLAKALATGTSRRVALKRFAAGLLGAAVASSAFGRPAAAQAVDGAEVPRECHEVCNDQRIGAGRSYGNCMSACTQCLANGGQIFIVNGGSPNSLVCI